jgi:uncharacterized alpha-E superfamily protein
MLSRNADHAFWMARYTERAENTAHMLQVYWQSEALPQSQSQTSSQSSHVSMTGWEAVLAISELQSYFQEQYGEKSIPDAKNVLEFMIQDKFNFASIFSCFYKARENARAIRNELNSELWEAYNTTWIELQEQCQKLTFPQDAPIFFEWMSKRCQQIRGILFSTFPDNEITHFLSLGFNIERADNTARILDLKFNEIDHHTPDFYYWATVLRSFSAFEVYRKTYKDVISPAKIADLLILRSDMPRSLRTCLEKIYQLLLKVKNQYSDEVIRQVGKVMSSLQFKNIEVIMEQGMHEYLKQFLKEINQIAEGVGIAFLTPFPSISSHNN